MQMVRALAPFCGGPKLEGRRSARASGPLVCEEPYQSREGQDASSDDAPPPACGTPGAV